jgi:hypothetical protein
MVTPGGKPELSGRPLSSTVELEIGRCGALPLEMDRLGEV